VCVGRWSGEYSRSERRFDRHLADCLYIPEMREPNRNVQTGGCRTYSILEILVPWFAIRLVPIHDPISADGNPSTNEHRPGRPTVTPLISTGMFVHASMALHPSGTLYSIPSTPAARQSHAGHATSQNAPCGTQSSDGLSHNSLTFSLCHSNFSLPATRMDLSHGAQRAVDSRLMNTGQRIGAADEDRLERHDPKQTTGSQLRRLMFPPGRVRPYGNMIWVWEGE